VGGKEKKTGASVIIFWGAVGGDTWEKRVGMVGKNLPGEQGFWRVCVGWGGPCVFRVGGGGRIYKRWERGPSKGGAGGGAGGGGRTKKRKRKREFYRLKKKKEEKKWDRALPLRVCIAEEGEGRRTRRGP